MNGTCPTCFLQPGMLVAQADDIAITTVLGSCVSVCLWDDRTGIGGMNHYLLPLWNGEGLKTPRYGNVAIPLLVEKLLCLGCERRNLKAKVFGGAALLEMGKGLMNIGQRNTEFAEDALSEAGIKIVCRDTGGTLGRKILFRTGSGEVLLKRVNPSDHKGR